MTASTGIAPDPEPFAGLPLDEPLIDEETWDKAGKALVAAEPEGDDS